jgi:hypothetical protein
MLMPRGLLYSKYCTYVIRLGEYPQHIFCGYIVFITQCLKNVQRDDWSMNEPALSIEDGFTHKLIPRIGGLGSLFVSY